MKTTYEQVAQELLKQDNEITDAYFRNCPIKTEKNYKNQIRYYLEHLTSIYFNDLYDGRHNIYKAKIDMFNNAIDTPEHLILLHRVEGRWLQDMIALGRQKQVLKANI